MDLESVLPSAELSSAGSAARAFAVVDEQKRAPLPTDLELHAADAACTMRPARTRRVYVLQGVNGGFYHEFITFVNEPVLLTIANGVRAYEAQRATGGASWTVHVRTNFSAIGVQRLLAVPGALCAKDVLVWVGHLSRLEQQMPWNQLRARAVHTVVYSTEPLDLGQECLYPGLDANRLDEIWDFAQHNVDVCGAYLRKRHATPPRMRHVPLAANDRSVRVLHSEAPPPLVLFGKIPPGNSWRRAFWISLTSHLVALGASPQLLRQVYNIWKPEQYATFLRSGRASIFLNVHKGCGDAHNPITFRVARLLSARALLISESAYDADMADYDGLVDFYPLQRNETSEGYLLKQHIKQLPPSPHGHNSSRGRLSAAQLYDRAVQAGPPPEFGSGGVAALASGYLRLAAMSAQQREELAKRRHREFARRFAPAAVFRRAGIFDLLEQLGR